MRRKYMTYLNNNLFIECCYKSKVRVQKKKILLSYSKNYSIKYRENINTSKKSEENIQVIKIMTCLFNIE